MATPTACERGCAPASDCPGGFRIEGTTGLSPVTEQPLASLWVARAPERTSKAHLDTLSSSELDRWRLLRGHEPQARFACAHALLRQILARHLSLAPGELSFAEELQGRPILGTGSADTASFIDFNISTTPSLVAVVLSTRARAGVDLERPADLTYGDALARQYLTDREQQWVNQGDNKGRFARIWTLKEAVSKAHGEGLGLGFDRLQVLPREDGSISTDLDRVTDKPWRLISWKAEVPGALALLGDSEGHVDLQPDPLPGFDFLSVTLVADQAGPDRTDR